MHRAGGDAPIHWRNNFCVGEIQFGLLKFGLGLLDGGSRGLDARFAQGHFRFGGVGLTARGLQIGVGGSRLRLGQIKGAFGHRTTFNGLVTLEIIVRPLGFRFGGGHCRLRLRDFGLTHFDLRLRLIRLALAAARSALAWERLAS